MIPETRSDPEIQWVDLPRGRVAVTDVGDGPPVVAVHGMPGSVRDWRYLGAVVEGPLRLVRIDLPGFGDSPPLGRALDGVDLYARVVIDVLDALHIGHATFVSHSFGGVITTALGVWHPARVAGLALLASPGLRPHAGVRGLLRIRPVLGLFLSQRHLRVALMPLMRRAFRHLGFPEGLPDETIVRATLAVDREILAGHASRLERLDAPTLLAWCDDDPLVEPDIVTEAAALLPDGPRLHFAEGGHNLHKHHAVEIGEALLDWVPRL